MGHFFSEQEMERTSLFFLTHVRNALNGLDNALFLFLRFNIRTYPESRIHRLLYPQAETLIGSCKP